MQIRTSDGDILKPSVDGNEVKYSIDDTVVVSIEFIEESLSELDLEVAFGFTIDDIQVISPIGFVDNTGFVTTSDGQPAPGDEAIIITSDEDFVTNALISLDGVNPIGGVVEQGIGPSDGVKVFTNTNHVTVNNLINLNTIAKPTQGPLANKPFINAVLTYSQSNELILALEYEPASVRWNYLRMANGQTIISTSGYTGDVYIK